MAGVKPTREDYVKEYKARCDEYMEAGRKYDETGSIGYAYQRDYLYNQFISKLQLILGIEPHVPR